MIISKSIKEEVLAVCCSGASRCVLPMPRSEDMSNDKKKEVKKRGLLLLINLRRSIIQQSERFLLLLNSHCFILRLVKELIVFHFVWICKTLAVGIRSFKYHYVQFFTFLFLSFLFCNNFQPTNQPINVFILKKALRAAGLSLFQVKVEKHWVFLHLPFCLMAVLLSHYSSIILSHPCVGFAFTSFIIVFFSSPFLCVLSCFVFFCASKNKIIKINKPYGTLQFAVVLNFPCSLLKN